MPVATKIQLQTMIDRREIGLVRPHFNLDKDYHSDKWKDITVLICSRKDKALIQLTIESFQRFYPDVNILVVDGNSQDDSLIYLRWKAITSNVQLVELYDNVGQNSHGTTMDFALRNHVKTKYCLLMDSDVITQRGGWLESMYTQCENEDLYATGTLMQVSRAGHACQAPKDDADILRYAHPSCSLYRAKVYKVLERFVDHGAPCVYNMIDAEAKGLQIGYFPIDKYVSHLSGASWCVPRTIWQHDYGVPLRPFVTFITDKHIEILSKQTDKDFDIINTGYPVQKAIVLHSDGKRIDLNNNLYSIRFNVMGEYVCRLTEYVENVNAGFVTLIKSEVIKQKAPDMLEVGGLILHRRNYWQNKICLL